MFKLPDPPSPQAEPHELADFAEWISWKRGVVSEREILALLGRIDDNDNNVGCDDDDDENAESLDEVMNELERRAVACGSGYPYELDRAGTVLRPTGDSESPRTIVYRFLLMSTRLNMTTQRVHAELDATKLFELLCAHILKMYLGDVRSSSFVFGTAVEGSFHEKVTDLCNKLHEGKGFESLDDAPTQANDDKLDVVGWIPFSDLLPGQLIVFGQCKTGNHWEGQVAQLQPDVFVKKWMRGTVVVNPVRAFFISEAPDRTRWQGTAAASGILFDRCRVIDFSNGLEAGFLADLKRWTDAAKAAVS